MATERGPGEERTPSTRASAAELRELLDSVLHDNADGILIVDAHGVVLEANEAAMALLRRDRLVGHPFGRPAFAGSTTEIDVATDEGVRIVEMRAAETVLDDRQATVVSLRDVTRRKQVEQSLRDFVSMTSHEFRTPLTAITGFARTLLAQWDATTDEVKKRQLEVILRQGTRMARLTTDLLSITRLDADAVEPFTEHVDIAAAVDEAVMILDETLYDIDVDVSGVEEVTSSVDVDHLQEILVNLISNAAKYGRPPIELAARRVGDDIVITVRDHGDGVPAELESRLFGRFERASEQQNRRGDGTGLGLAIVAGLVERNKGTVTYGRAEGGGAVFTVVLPA